MRNASSKSANLLRIVRARARTDAAAPVAIRAAVVGVATNGRVASSLTVRIARGDPLLVIEGTNCAHTCGQIARVVKVVAGVQVSAGAVAIGAGGGGRVWITWVHDVLDGNTVRMRNRDLLGTLSRSRCWGYRSTYNATDTDKKKE